MKISVAFFDDVSGIFQDQDFTFSLRALFSKIKHYFLRISVSIFLRSRSRAILTNMALLSVS